MGLNETFARNMLQIQTWNDSSATIEATRGLGKPQELINDVEPVKTFNTKKRVRLHRANDAALLCTKFISSKRCYDSHTIHQSLLMLKILTVLSWNRPPAMETGSKEGRTFFLNDCLMGLKLEILVVFTSARYSNKNLPEPVQKLPNRKCSKNSENTYFISIFVRLFTGFVRKNTAFVRVQLSTGAKYV